MYRLNQNEWQHTTVTWWLLYLIALLLVAVVGLIEIFVEGGLRTILESAVAVAGFGSIWAWLRHNRIALEFEQGRRRT
jgi:hypothetical protein